MSVFKKRLTNAVIVVALLLQSAFTSANLITDYDLEFSPVDDVMVGETFDVQVSLDSDLFDDLFSFGFDITSPLSNVDYNGFTVAAYNGIEPMLFDEFDVGGFVLGFPVDNLLATLHFTATDVGSENIAFYSGVVGFGGAQFYDFFNDGSVGGSFDVNVVAAQVPEPSTIFLAGLGLVGLMLNRRKVNR